MATFWTAEIGGVEKTFGDWKFSGGKLLFKSLAPDVFTVRQTVADISEATAIAFEGQIKVRRGRTRLRTGALSGGRIVFVGYRTGATAFSESGSQGFQYSFEGPLYLLGDLMYRQEWFSGLTTHVLIGLDQDGAYVRTGSVIGDVLSYAGTQGVTINSGSIEPGLYVPVDDKVDVPCIDVMRQMARWSPDAVSFFDYSTEPTPTFHFKRRSAMEVLSFDVPADRSTRTQATPRYDLRKDYVLLLFEQTSDVDGEQRLTIVPQVAPVGHAGTGRRGLVSTINLQGPRFSVTEAEVLSEAFAPGDENVAAAASDYWIARIPALQTGRYVNATVTYLGAKDAAGNTLDVAGLGYELVEGQLLEEMELEDGSAVDWEKVRLWFELSFEQQSADGEVIGRGKQRLFIDKTVTNAPSGTYTITVQEDLGEPIGMFAGMADYLYSAMSELQFEGSHSFVDEDDFLADADVPSWLGKVINLTGDGAQPGWATMNALVTQADVDCDTNVVTLKFGPAPHLELGDILDLTRNNRNRRNATPKRTRTDGSVASESVTLGKGLPDSQAHQAIPELKVLTIRDPDTGAMCRITPTSIVIQDPQANNVVSIAIGSNNQKIYLDAGALPQGATAGFQATDGCAGNAQTTRRVLRD